MASPSQQQALRSMIRTPFDKTLKEVVAGKTYMARGPSRLRCAGSQVTSLLNRQEQCCQLKHAPCMHRYSPNLSKRTTHLVTPEVVGSVTEKLAAAAAGPGQQRFKALQVVSKCWVSASSGLRQRADERQFAPLLPPPGTAVPDASSAVSSWRRLVLYGCT